MCGIFGYWTVRTPRHTEAAGAWDILTYALADAMEKRGRHSWGWVLIDYDTAIEARGMGPITDHVQGMPPAGWRACITHTRYATYGDRTLANTHPFQYGDVRMVHNGGIHNVDDLPDPYVYQVDSQALAARIAGHVGESDASDLHGYGACVWADLSLPKPEINICRMRTGDLEVASVREPGGGRWLVWASKLSAVSYDLKKAGWTVRPMPTLREGRVYRVYGPDLYRTGRELRLQPGYGGRRCATTVVRSGDTPSYRDCFQCGAPRELGSACARCKWTPWQGSTKVYAGSKDTKCPDCGYYFNTSCDTCMGEDLETTGPTETKGPSQDGTQPPLSPAEIRKIKGGTGAA